ncbi:MAG: hypothetical protein AABZ94_08860 [Candidatus Eisenbacteria bacterium]
MTLQGGAHFKPKLVAAVLALSLLAGPGPAAAPRTSAIDSLTARAARADSAIVTLRGEVSQQKVAREFFASTISVQTGILTTIVVLVLGLIGLVSYLQVGGLIRTEVAKAKGEIEDSLRLKAEARAKEDASHRESLDKRIDVRFKSLRTTLSYQKAALNRAFATMHEDKPVVAFIWWLRAVSAAPDAETKAEWLNFVLNNAKKLTTTRQVAGIIDEVQGILAGLDQDRFAIQIRAIRAEVERVASISEPKDK